MPSALSSGILFGARILVVDDDPAVRRLLTRFLERLGAHVSVAADASAALTHLERESCNLVLTDIDMPGQSGLWLVEIASARWPSLPTLVLTGGPRDTHEVEVIERCAAGLLLKPVQFDELRRRIAEALASSGTE